MEAKLQSLKVPELKELLHSAGLAVTGNKPDLIKRALENPNVLEKIEGGKDSVAAQEPKKEAEKAAEQSSTEPAEKPADKAAPALAAKPAPAQAKAETDGKAQAKPAPDAGAPAAPSEEEQLNTQLEELRKRKTRAARFGESTEEIDRKIHRLERFGLVEQTEVDMSRLNSELKSGKRGRIPEATAPKPKAPKKEGQTPEQLEARNRRAERFGLPIDKEEEEKKKRRMERFGSGAQK